MKNRRSHINCFFIFLTTCILVYPYTGRGQVISDTADTINLHGMQLVELVNYIKDHSFSIEDYLKKNGFYKNDNGTERCYQNESSKCRVYLTDSDNQHIPKNIADIKQECVVIKSKDSNFKEAIEKIIYDLKTDDNFGVDIDRYKGEYSFYSIKKDFYIRVLFDHEYDVVAIY